MSSIRDRLEAPIERVVDLKDRTLGAFPVRVWRHFLQNNGFLLAAGVSYQALFAIFAAIYLAISVIGLWLHDDEIAIGWLIDFINSYIPGLITPTSDFATPELVEDIAAGATGLLSVTGAIALVAVVWTAIGWVTFSRRAVRDIFGLPPDLRNYAVLKGRDLIAAAIFGVALVAGSLLSSASGAFLSWLLELIGWDAGSTAVNLVIRLGTVVVSFVILSGALASLVRFLTGTSLHWRTIWPGALLGGGAMTVLQYSAGFLLGYTPRNALLATFALFVGLLLWFRINGVVMLVAAAWIAVSARDRDVPLVHRTEAERAADEHRALLAAAHVQVRDARRAVVDASWLGRFGARRALHDAERRLAALEADTERIEAAAEESRRRFDRPSPRPTGRSVRDPG